MENACDWLNIVLDISCNDQVTHLWIKSPSVGRIFVTKTRICTALHVPTPTHCNTRAHTHAHTRTHTHARTFSESIYIQTWYNSFNFGMSLTKVGESWWKTLRKRCSHGNYVVSILIEWWCHAMSLWRYVLLRHTLHLTFDEYLLKKMVRPMMRKRNVVLFSFLSLCRQND